MQGKGGKGAHLMMLSAMVLEQLPEGGCGGRVRWYYSWLRVVAGRVAGGMREWGLMVPGAKKQHLEGGCWSREHSSSRRI